MFYFVAPFPPRHFHTHTRTHLDDAALVAQQGRLDAVGVDDGPQGAAVGERQGCQNDASPAPARGLPLASLSLSLHPPSLSSPCPRLPHRLPRLARAAPTVVVARHARRRRRRQQARPPRRRSADGGDAGVHGRVAAGLGGGQGARREEGGGVGHDFFVLSLSPGAGTCAWQGVSVCCTLEGGWRGRGGGGSCPHARAPTK